MAIDYYRFFFNFTLISFLKNLIFCFYDLFKMHGE